MGAVLVLRVGTMEVLGSILVVVVGAIEVLGGVLVVVMGAVEVLGGILDAMVVLLAQQTAAWRQRQTEYHSIPKELAPIRWGDRLDRHGIMLTGAQSAA